MATRFRTQDTKASWAKKLSFLLTPPSRMFREVPQTRTQWQIQLNAAVAYALSQGYSFTSRPLFRLSDTRQMWARKLNVLAAGLEGVAMTLTISQIMGDDAVTAAEAAAVTISGTSANVANTTVVTLTATSSTGVVTQLGTTTVTSNAWTKTAIVMTGLAIGTYVITATAPGAKTATRTITRTA